MTLGAPPRHHHGRPTAASISSFSPSGSRRQPIDGLAGNHRGECIPANILPTDFGLQSTADTASSDPEASKPHFSGRQRRSGHPLKVEARVRTPLGLPHRGPVRSSCDYRTRRLIGSGRRRWVRPVQQLDRRCGALRPSSRTRRHGGGGPSRSEVALAFVLSRRCPGRSPGPSP